MILFDAMTEAEVSRERKQKEWDLSLLATPPPQLRKEKNKKGGAGGAASTGPSGGDDSPMPRVRERSGTLDFFDQISSGSSKVIMDTVETNKNPNSTNTLRISATNNSNTVHNEAEKKTKDLDIDIKGREKLQKRKKEAGRLPPFAVPYLSSTDKKSGQLKKVGVIKRQKLTTIGRSKSNNIVVNGLSISRQHCSLELKESVVAIKDLSSTFGTFINGVKLEPKKRYFLIKGDKIQVGKVILNFEFSLATFKGWLEKRSGKVSRVTTGSRWTKKYCILRNGKMYISKSQDITGSKKLDLAKVTIVKEDTAVTTQFSLKIQQGVPSMHFKAPTQRDRGVWINGLKQQIAEEKKKKNII